MKTTLYQTLLKLTGSFFSLKLPKTIAIAALLSTVTQYNSQIEIEPEYRAPNWLFGIAGGANFNFYEGSTQKLDGNIFLPAAFHKGKGVGLFFGPLVEYRATDSRWGVMLQANYDNRSSSFDRVYSACNCPMDLSTKLSYLSIEPSARFAPFKSNLYFYFGPRIAFLYDKSYKYQMLANPSFPEQTDQTEVTGNLSDMKTELLSLQIGAGYDIQVSHSASKNKFMLSPFIAFHPYIGQNARTIETWNITTLRAGLAVKFGRGTLIEPIPIQAGVEGEKPVVIPVNFTVIAPKNIPVERRVKETFPIRNYVFFDLGSNKIPPRYVLISKNQVKDFKEDQLEVFKPKRLSGRSDRQLVAYYNILNILGDRMQKDPSSQIVLVGSSEKGEADGLAMAGSIRNYLVSTWEISASRIAMEGRLKPKNPSEQPGGKKELVLLREGDRRVTIETKSPALMMEFVSGSSSPLKPVEINASQTAPIDSYVIFNVEGARENFTSWRLEVKDAKGHVQYFGPYTQAKISLPGKSILGSTPEGDYQFKMIGKTVTGETVVKQSSAHLVLWKPATDEQGMRYSIIFDFNESDVSATYEKYLTEKVIAKIPINGTVILHGHTDVIGDSDKNMNLSEARTKEVKDILEKELKRLGRTDVTFEVLAFGEDNALSPFNNNYPEERFYNRTVIIDIIPKK